MGRVVCLAESESWLSEHKLESSEDKEVTASSSALNGSMQDQQQLVATSNKGKQPLRGPFVPTLEEVHEAFDHIKAIRYNQPLHLSGKSSPSRLMG
jgi:cleavage and polyadenylation specificity factor subunit 2